MPATSVGPGTFAHGVLRRAPPRWRRAARWDDGEISTGSPSTYWMRSNTPNDRARKPRMCVGSKQHWYGQICLEGDGNGNRDPDLRQEEQYKSADQHRGAASQLTSMGQLTSSQLTSMGLMGQRLMG
jgi:hypothetical protein